MIHREAEQRVIEAARKWYDTQKALSAEHPRTLYTNKKLTEAQISLYLELGNLAVAIDAAPDDSWQPIETAPTDGTWIWGWVAPYDDLPGFVIHIQYHPDAGWCADELRRVTMWQPAQQPPAPPDHHGEKK